MSSYAVASVLQVAFEVLMDSFGNTSMLAAMNEPAKYKSKLLCLMTAFCRFGKAWEKHKGDDMPEEEDLPVLLSGVAKGVCVLLTPFPEDGAGAEDLQKVLNYTGTNSLILATYRDILAKQTFWVRQTQELITKGSATMMLGPKMKELQTLLQDPGSVSASLINECTGHLPDFRKRMRSGSTTEFEKVFLSQLSASAEEFLKKPSSLSLASALLDGLQLFAQAKGVLQMVAKLDSMRAGQMPKLAYEDLKAVLSRYPAPSAETAVPSDCLTKKLKEVSDMLSQVDPSLAGELLPCFRPMAYWSFRQVRVQFQVPWCNLRSFLVLVYSKVS